MLTCTSRQVMLGTNKDAAFPDNLSFKCAVTDSKGPRRFMEDAHSVVVPFAGIHGQGFFAIFDGHAGKHAAEWCGQNFSLVRARLDHLTAALTGLSQYLLESLRKFRSYAVPDVLNQTFHDVDAALTKISEDSDGKMHSGCTAVTAFLRLEDSEGRQAFLPPEFDPLESASDLIEGSEEESNGEGTDGVKSSPKPKKRSKLRNALRSLGNSSHSRKGSQSSSSPTSSLSDSTSHANAHIFTPTADTRVRRVLYCANAGDARGVLCRSGKAVRLTYDHKGTDKQEAKRIMDAGGIVMSGRVNGVLAVTRSLGDSAMKEFVVGAPYTTETELSDDDEFMILACDGVRAYD